jgi:hypothetical protein
VREDIVIDKDAAWTSKREGHPDPREAGMQKLNCVNELVTDVVINDERDAGREAETVNGVSGAEPRTV